MYKSEIQAVTSMLRFVLSSKLRDRNGMCEQEQVDLIHREVFPAGELWEWENVSASSSLQSAWFDIFS